MRLLFVDNCSDLHANGLRLLNDVCGSVTTLHCAPCLFVVNYQSVVSFLLQYWIILKYIHFSEMTMSLT